MTDDTVIDPLDRAERQIRRMCEKYVDRSGLAFNPDRKVVEMIIKGLTERKLAKGYPYCPCRVLLGDPKQDAPKICPCAYHREEIARDGMCKCRIFVSKEYAETHGQ
jgi:ferredoxin-thioredoxin reductase catalytic subunit